MYNLNYTLVQVILVGTDVCVCVEDTGQRGKPPLLLTTIQSVYYKPATFLRSFIYICMIY